MHELRAQVERVVGPIRASRRRKDGMRQELLAHLQARFEEELAEGNGKAEAAHRAVKRFGAPDALRAELQASVPLFEQTLYAHVPFSGRLQAFRRYLRRREGESAAHHAGRAALSMGLTVLVLDALTVAPLVALDLVAGKAMLPAGQCAAFVAAFQAVPAFGCVVYILCLHGLQDAWATRRVARGGGWYLLASAATLGGGLAIVSLVGKFLNPGGASPFWAFVVAVSLTPVVLTWLGMVCIAERRREERERLACAD
jgi:hypothetical protein